MHRLRPASPEDFPAIRRLILRGKINPFGLHWSRFWVVVSSDDRVIACGQIKPHRDGSRELASIVVDPAEQGKGLARMVIDHLLEENPGTLYLTCRSSMEKMYEKFSFKTIELAEMPPTFKLLSRCVNLLYRLKIAPEAMLVMRNKTY
jgi:N-acetylglutamate synthase-like GNAT family acetyltransferase